MKVKKLEENYTADETARRRDEVVRHMANTPPQHVGKSKRTKQKKRTKQASRGSA
jgi:hypothetical protein